MIATSTGDFLFDRRVKLVIAEPLAEDYVNLSARTTEITDLRVTFRVTKSLDKTPNTAEIEVTNLAEQTRSALQGKSAKVVLYAGYEANLAAIFIGDVRTIDSERHGADWVTKINCGDGERSFTEARVSESFAPGVTVPDIVKKLVAAAGAKFPVFNQAGQLINTEPAQYAHGYVAHGRLSNELDKVLKANGYEYSIQDGELQILKPGESLKAKSVVLSADTGLLESPFFGTHQNLKKPPVLKAKSLLQPGIKPGGLVTLDTKHYQGDYKVLKVHHNGDTAGGPWYTEPELEVYR